MERRLIYLWSFCIHFATASCVTRCDAPSVYKDQPASVTCHFDIDVSKTVENVFVNITNDTGQYQVLDCIWLIDQRYCKASPGYFVDGNVTQELVLGIPAATPEYVGTYVCQMITSDQQNFMPCSFTLKDAADPAKDRDTVIIVVSVVGAILGASLIAIAIAMVCKYRNRLFGKRKLERYTSQDAETTEEQVRLEEPTADGEHEDRDMIPPSDALAASPCRMETTESKNLDTIRIVMIGKTGNGKSSLGNSILGIKDFKPGSGFSSETSMCDYNVGKRGNYEYKVVDTPGLCDVATQEGVYREIAKTAVFTAPGAHVGLFVLRCDRPFTQEEYEAYKTLKKLFGEEMCDHMIIVFNAMDAFSMNNTSDLTKMRACLKENLEKHSSKHLRAILDEVKWRYFGMTNNAPRDVIEEQIKDLCDLIQQLIASNKHSFYTCTFAKRIQERFDELVHECMKQDETSKKVATQRVTEEILEVKERSNRLGDVVRNFVNRAGISTASMFTVSK